jgi:hypothetical protein
VKLDLDRDEAALVYVGLEYFALYGTPDVLRHYGDLLDNLKRRLNDQAMAEFGKAL